MGILGGVFDPIHYGHLVVAREVREELSLDRVFFVPSASPPHKEESSLAPAKDRYRMAVLATRGDPYFSVSSLEIRRPGKSYSIETVKKFQKIYGPEVEIYFITGADAVLEIVTWKDVDELLRLCKFVVVPRPGFDIGKLEKRYREQVQVVKVSALQISSTDIRNRLRQGRSVRYLIPERVERYIRRRGLYGKKGDSPLFQVAKFK